MDAGKRERGKGRARDRSERLHKMDEPGPSQENQTEKIYSESCFMAPPAKKSQTQKREGFHESIETVITRPRNLKDKTGRTGQPIRIQTNLFKLRRGSDGSFYQHHVTFKPEIEIRRLKRILFNHAAQSIGLSNNFLFDGMLLFTGKKIVLNNDLVIQDTKTGENYVVSIKFTQVVDKNNQVTLQIYNIIMKRYVLNQLGFVLMQRNYFDYSRQLNLQNEKLTIWPGYITSIDTYDSGLNLLVEVTHKILSNQTLLDLLYEIQNFSKSYFREEARKQLIGRVLMTRYNRRTYRIDDIDWGKTPESTFKLKNESETSYIEYYKTKYKIEIKDRKQPILLSTPTLRQQRAGQEGPLYLIPELCLITGISDKIRNNFQTMKSLAQHTKSDPNKRVVEVKDLYKRIYNNPKVMENLKTWDLKLEPELMETTARVLPGEKILLGAGRSEKLTEVNPSAEKANWGPEMRNQKLLSLKNLENWAMVYPKKLEREASNFFQTLQQAGRQLGMKIDDPYTYPLETDHNQSYLHSFKTLNPNKTDLVMILLLSNKGDKYEAIKRHLCCENPIPSQVMLAKTLNKNAMAVATKVAIQINCKLGGEGWGVIIPKLTHAMVIGIDTYHDSAFRGRSVVGIVASLNRTFTRYYTRWGFQRNCEEMGSCLMEAVRQCIEAYKKSNQGSPPEKVFVYRDGVSDGQLKMVLDYELPQIKKAFDECQISPKFAMIVVKKRINSRFFQASGNRINNPPPGTIVDTMATKPEWYDFFLIAQIVREGTVNPTHFNVIYDTSGLPPDAMQRLTFKLCHLYFNWQGTVRVPAPCQYAHKVAFLIGTSLHISPHPKLADTLFYL